MPKQTTNPDLGRIKYGRHVCMKMDGRELKSAEIDNCKHKYNFST